MPDEAPTTPAAVDDPNTTEQPPTDETPEASPEDAAAPKTALELAEAGEVVLIRWVGQPVQRIRRKNKATGEISEEIDYEFERNREAPTPGHSIRFIRPVHVPGLSRIYQWGRNYPFITAVTPEDAALIMESPAADRFRVYEPTDKVGKLTLKRIQKDGGIRGVDDPFDTKALRQVTGGKRG